MPPPRSSPSGKHTSAVSDAEVSAASAADPPGGAIVGSATQPGAVPPAVANSTTVNNQPACLVFIGIDDTITQNYFYIVGARLNFVQS
jgi:hypothetical protein